ncbi:MAG: hypothetical protein JRJ02_02095 [Deltaproteobacteria bacterium]|nr:hypothetical protein [Deltaproteobacteria bacterium]
MRVISIISILTTMSLFGCAAGVKHLKSALVPTDIKIIRYHVGEYYKSLEEFTWRLYLKNPKYEKDLKMRKKKIRGIFYGEELPHTVYNNQLSHKVLEAAFGANPTYEDRVFLLSLGLVKAIRETYNIEESMFVTSLEIPPEKLERLYFNISHLNWRLKVYRDERGKLLFLTNEAGENGYINMGYEIIMTGILTRIKDDIFLRDGATPKLLFKMSTLFLPLILL